jgi:hypothetical protein
MAILSPHVNPAARYGITDSCYVGEGWAEHRDGLGFWQLRCHVKRQPGPLFQGLVHLPIAGDYFFSLHSWVCSSFLKLKKVEGSKINFGKKYLLLKLFYFAKAKTHCAFTRQEIYFNRRNCGKKYFHGKIFC